MYYSLALFSPRLEPTSIQNNHNKFEVKNSKNGIQFLNKSSDINQYLFSTNKNNQSKSQSRELEDHAFSLLHSCTSFHQLTQIHAHIIRNSIHHNNFVIAKLISLCFTLASHDPSYALHVFDQMPHPNTFLWNTLIQGLVRLNAHHDALLFYVRMLTHGFAPNNFTFPFAIKACSKLLAAQEGKTLHGQVLKLGFSSDIYVQTSLLDFYGFCCEIAAARQVFDRMPGRDVVSWNAIVASYVRCGLVELAQELFDEMPVRNVSSWTVMMGGFVQIGKSSEALRLFRQMQIHGVKPDKMALVTVLSAVADLGTLDIGKWIHDYAEKNGINIDAFIGTALIDMYAKSGSIQDAKVVFDDIDSKTISCYNAMIMAFAIHGLGEEAIKLFEDAERAGVGIDDVTVLAILSACRHSGLVNEGFWYFNSMKEKYRIEAKIEHCGCMIDLLGRAGRFDEAMEMVESIEVNYDVLGTLCNACRIHGNIELGEELARRMSELDPSNSGLLVLKSNMYAMDGRWEEVAAMRRLMRERGIEKKPGCSWIEVSNVVHEFVAGDHSHPCSKEIYSKLEELCQQMKLL